jgi:hypothetical protein
MSNFRIIYPNENGGISLIVPVEGFTVEQVLKDVPLGSPFIILDPSDVPSDFTFFDAWEADFTNAQVRE